MSFGFVKKESSINLTAEQYRSEILISLNQNITTVKAAYRNVITRSKNFNLSKIIRLSNIVKLVFEIFGIHLRHF